MWSSDIVTLADSIDRAGFQSRYARSFKVMVAVNSVAPDWLFTHRRRGKSIISVYVPCRSRANLLQTQHGPDPLRVNYCSIRHADRAPVWPEGGERGAVIGH